MPQYNNQYTYETLQKLKLAVVPDTLDKREGSVIWNAISANSYALSIAFMQMGINQANMFPDTASRKYLIRHCSLRGITPKPATYAVIKGRFYTSVITKSPFNPDIGTRFGVKDSDMIYGVSKQIEDGVFELTCETAGTSGNLRIGTLVPVDEIQALGNAEILELVTAGEDEESTESLRERYMDSLKAVSFAGNKAAYREMAVGIEGVGACKVYRAYNNQAGHVGLCILNDNLSTPTEELVTTVQNMIDPTQDGEGYGMAPIDHIVHVFGATESTINVSVKITPIYTTTTWDNISQTVTDEISAYFQELNSTWDTTDKLVVRPSQIIARLLRLDVVLDVTECKVNGGTSNVQLESAQIAKVGAVSGSITQSA